MSYLQVGKIATTKSVRGRAARSIGLTRMVRLRIHLLKQLPYKG